jgi:hypothetical protein
MSVEATILETVLRGTKSISIFSLQVLKETE